MLNSNLADMRCIISHRRLLQLLEAPASRQNESLLARMYTMQTSRSNWFLLPNLKGRGKGKGKGKHDCMCATKTVLLVQGPRSSHDRVYVLPLLTIKLNKGTGSPSTTISSDQAH